VRGGGWAFVQLRSADLTGAELVDVRLTEADLSGANLTDAVLTGCDLSRADLRQTVLSGTDLRGSQLGGVDPQGPRWAGARIDLAQAVTLAQALGAVVDA
jgi:fluoroquinolone resistance protein